MHHTAKSTFQSCSSSLMFPIAWARSQPKTLNFIQQHFLIDFNILCFIKICFIEYVWNEIVHSSLEALMYLHRFAVVENRSSQPLGFGKFYIGVLVYENFPEEGLFYMSYNTFFYLSHHDYVTSTSLGIKASIKMCQVIYIANDLH